MPNRSLPTTQRRRPRFGHPILVRLGAAAILAVCAAVTIHHGMAARPVADFADGPVTSQEVDFYRALATNGTLTTGATTPALLRQVAHDRALFALAQQAHITGNIPSVEDLLADQRNTSQSVAATGQPVYGTGSYTAAESYSRTLSNLQAATIAALTTGTHPLLVATRHQVNEEIRQHPDEWSSAATTYIITTWTVPARVGNQSGQQILDRVRGRIIDPKIAAQMVPGSTVEQRSVPAAALASTGLAPDVQAAIPLLHPGQMLPPQPVHNRWVLYQLTGSTIDPQRAFRDYAPAISQQLVQHQFTTLLDQRARLLLSGPHR